MCLGALLVVSGTPSRCNLKGVAMYNNGIVLGASTTTTGAVSAALLPNTGSFKPLFFMAVATCAVGVITLAATGVFALKNRSSRV